MAAMDEKRGIGRNGQIPWKIPEDMRHFKELTMGHPVIMGRVTWESIPARFRPLPGRNNIVVTRSSDMYIPGVAIAHSVAQAINIAYLIDAERISIIGGAQIYKQGLPLANRLDLTLLEGDFNCDAFFPDYEGLFQEVVYQTDWQTSNRFTFRFVSLRGIV